MRTMMLTILGVLGTAFTPAHAWDGTDNNGTNVTIERGNLVRRGEEIEFYDEATGDYHTGEVEHIRDTGYGTEVEVYDHDRGEYRLHPLQKTVVADFEFF